MKKAVLYLPKNILNRYVINHIKELTPEEFLLILDKIKVKSYLIPLNENLAKDGRILRKMLAYDHEAYRNFQESAIDKGTVKVMGQYPCNFTYEYLLSHPLILTDKKTCIRMLNTDIRVLQLIDRDMMDDELLGVLVFANFTPTIDDIIKFPRILDNSDLVLKALEKNPQIIFMCDNIDEYMINTILSNGFIPKIEDFERKPEFKRFISLIDKCFEYDYKAMYLYDLNNISSNKLHYILNSAIVRGFVATKEDFIKYPVIRTYKYVTREAINSDPTLIIYADYWDFSESYISDVFSRFELTEEFIEENYNIITENGNPMQYFIADHYPQFKKYFNNALNSQDKVTYVMDVLSSGKKIDEHTLPFLSTKYGSSISIESYQRLVDVLSLNINEEDEKSQDYYFSLVNQLASSISKSSFSKISEMNIQLLNMRLNEIFKIQDPTRLNNELEEFVNQLNNLVLNKLDIGFIWEKINEFYQVYLQNKYVGLDVTTPFFNILKTTRFDYLVASQKEKIMVNAPKGFELSEKRIRREYNKNKIDEIKQTLYEDDYETLGTSQEEFETNIDNIITTLKNNKAIKKLNIPDNLFEELKKYFLNNYEVKEDDVVYILQIKDKEAIKFICKKLNDFLLRFIPKVSDEEVDYLYNEDIVRKHSIFSAANYKILSKDNYYQALCKILLNLDDEKIDIILSNTYLEEFAFLVPLVNKIDGFDTQMFINLLFYCDSLIEDLIPKNILEKNESLQSYIFDKLESFITLAKSYSSLSDLYKYALGKDCEEKVSSVDSKRYYEAYEEMMKHKKKSIPPVSVTTNDYVYESGRSNDTGRLLLDSIYSGYSCISLDNSYEGSMFNEVNFQENGDVILIRDNKNKLVGRILMCRRGNVVCLVTQWNISFPKEVYTEIASQILAQSKEKGDCIDYVLVNINNVKNYDKDREIINNTIKNIVNEPLFPHADYDGDCFVAGKSERVSSKDDINFKMEHTVLYDNVRHQPNYSPTDDEINRIAVLLIFSEKNMYYREMKMRGYKFKTVSSYEKIACGEDYYIGVKKDGTIEEVILPYADDKAYEEIDEIKKSWGVSLT